MLTFPPLTFFCKCANFKDLPRQNKARIFLYPTLVICAVYCNFNFTNPIILYDFIFVLGGIVLSVLVIAPRVSGANPAEGDGFLRAIKIRRTTSFGREVKLRRLKEKIRKANSFTSPVFLLL
jgi:hypothetical protein